MNQSEIKAMSEAALVEAGAAVGPAELEAVRVKYLGRKGLIPDLMRRLKDVPASDRPEIGRLLNEFRARLEHVIATRRGSVASSGGGANLAAAAADVTLPGRWRGAGVRHPISAVIEDAVAIFARMGFTVADGPDIETEYHNFDALNTPADHPSRDTQDTFWLEDGRLLRTQTSPVQIRVMESQAPPVRIVAPGRCYRRDTCDATHSANFHQIEGLYVDARVSMADLKSDLACFARLMMGPEVRVRFRPHFFPFTEPSVEYDFSCHMCGGRGCRVCKDSGWIEISGAGMVDPRVLAKVGYDPETTSGYAFGMGVERIAMIRYGITDIRLLYENDIGFLEQIAP